MLFWAETRRRERERIQTVRRRARIRSQSHADAARAEGGPELTEGPMKRAGSLPDATPISSLRPLTHAHDYCFSLHGPRLRPGLGSPGALTPSNHPSQPRDHLSHNRFCSRPSLRREAPGSWWPEGSNSRQWGTREAATTTTERSGEQGNPWRTLEAVQ